MKLLAIEWDAREARIAVAQTRGKDVVLEDAFAIDLTGLREGGGESQVGQQIASALAARNVGRAETLVAVGRANIELRQMTLPPAPPEEWPEMVRFQAQRQFTTIGTDWPLDFVPLTGRQNESGSEVLAAAISPAIVTQISEVCKHSELAPKRLVLRPFAAASLLCRHDRGTRQPGRLMVDMLKEDADLTVLVDQQVILMRTVRLPTTDDVTAQNRALIGEIRRTIAAAQNQMHGKRVERVVVCGDRADQVALRESISTELSYETTVFEPFAEVDKAPGLDQRLPDHSGRFAPLIGMLMDEAAGASHALDFLHPRKKPEPPNTRRRNVLLAATAAVAALCIAGLLWMSLAARDEEIARLRRESNSLQDDVRQAEENRADLKAIREFQESDITWLDELYELSQAIPPSEDVLITRLSLETRQPGGGQIVLDGYAQGLDEVNAIRTALRGKEGRPVKAAGNLDTPKRTDYRWRFKETALIPPQAPRSPAEAARPAEADPEPSQEPPDGVASREPVE